MAKYTKKERSEAAKKGWRERKRRFWIDRSVKVIGKVPVGRVGIPINE